MPTLHLEYLQCVAMENIDSAEIAKFESLAARWWDPNSEFAPLHEINPLRLGDIANRHRLHECRALDVGCGGGLLSEALSEQGATVTGLDAGAGPITVAKLHARATDHNIDYRHLTIVQFVDEIPAPFDVICCLEMLEHVPDPALTIKSCVKL